MSSIYKEVAMLTCLRAEMPQMTKKDDLATSAAEQAMNAHQAGHYRKNLYPKHLIDPITSIISQSRAYMYSQTRPSMFPNEYILPNRRIITYLDQMAKNELAFWQAVTAFLNNWTNVMLEAQGQQGHMFDSLLYPDTATLKSHFMFEYPIRQIPGGADCISAELDADVADVVKAKITKSESEAQGLIIATAYQDLRQQVLRIIKQTTPREVANKKGELELKTGKIYDTLTQDIADLTSLLSDLGCGGDPKLQEVVEAIDMHLTLPADALRADVEVCKITANKAKEILEMLA